MNKKNQYSETLRYFRKAKGIKQKDIFPEQHQKYSRIELGGALTLKDWLKCLKELELTPSEYLSAVKQTDNYILEIDKQFKRTCEDPTFTLNQTALIKNFKYLESIKDKNTSELCLYVDIKLFFCEKFPEIPAVSENDIEYFFNLFDEKIQKQSVFTYYDYRLFSNILFILPSDELKKVDKYFNKMYPIKNSLERDYNTLHVAYLAYPNLVNRLIYEKNYEKAQQYLNKTKKIYIPKNQHLVHTQLKYMQHLLNYLTTHSPKEFATLLEIVKALKILGNKELAKQMSNEIDLLVAETKIEINKGDYPKIEHSIK
ncbi:MutR family transcriptional regulator [Enterococcus faecalis]|uniref:Rgg family transcriptional regulator n=1 Tax=Enterococcus faecalis TaxID=1351 RepID=UPI0027FC6123|nr:MutR family transcriptional regulator [Enterococcus faecalis]EKZ0221968.1 MutR family transcriptional regulator [Enterococcus faecalis]MEC0988885.1 MutR family transcriptional regulator [Enterococcus faecalis]